jgi:hypothetical protein
MFIILRCNSESNFNEASKKCGIFHKYFLFLNQKIKLILKFKKKSKKKRLWIAMQQWFRMFKHERS